MERRIENWKDGKLEGIYFPSIMFGMMDGKLKGCIFLCLVLDEKLDGKEKYIYQIYHYTLTSKGYMNVTKGKNVK